MIFLDYNGDTYHFCSRTFAWYGYQRGASGDGYPGDSIAAPAVVSSKLNVLAKDQGITLPSRPVSSSSNSDSSDKSERSRSKLDNFTSIFEV